MSNNFYTNAQIWGNQVLYRGIKNGKRISQKIHYSPKMYVRTPESKGPFMTIFEEPVTEMPFGTIKEAKDFVEKYKDVQGMSIYGNTRFEYNFITELFPSEVEYDVSKISVANIDIECGSENGFPEPELANEPVTAITYKQGKKFYVFGCGNFKTDREDVQYILCSDEFHLLSSFLGIWEKDYPDIVTGWNIENFDIPYLVNRIRKVMGDNHVKRLSPWGIIRDKMIDFGMGRKFQTYRLIGLAILDYIDMYQRYAPEGKSQESYRLDAIANAELGIGKLSYEEHGNLHQLYRLDFQKFIDYNIRDVELVDRLEDKLKLIELVLTLAYQSKTNYEDAFTQVRMWDILIYNFLLERNQVVPLNTLHRKDERYEGAYVKDPIIGRHKWMVSFDLTSLYPSLMQQYNISPETLVEPENYTDDMRKLLSQSISVDNLLDEKVDFGDVLSKNNVTMTPNGQFFRRNKQGFLPEILSTMFDNRIKYKKTMLKYKKELEVTKTEDERNSLEKLISKFDNLQLATKVCLNSAYGALGNEWFRFFDIRQALGITTGGQLSIRWIQKYVNSYLNKVLKTSDVDYVVASDTDSLYINFSKFVEDLIPTSDNSKIVEMLDQFCQDKVQKVLNDSFQKLADYINAFSQKMFMKRECIASPGVWTAKKRYALMVYDNEGVRYREPHLKISGLEVKKSSTPMACRTKLEEALNIIMVGTEQELQKFLSKFKQEFKELPAADIAFPRGVNGLSKYSQTGIYDSGTPMHVRGSLLYNHHIKRLGLTKKYPIIKEGEKIKFLYLKEPNILQSNTIAFPNLIPEEFDIQKDIDYNTQYSKAFLEPLKIILDAIGWKPERKVSLRGFMK